MRAEKTTISAPPGARMRWSSVNASGSKMYSLGKVESAARKNPPVKGRHRRCARAASDGEPPAAGDDPAESRSPPGRPAAERTEPRDGVVGPGECRVEMAEEPPPESHSPRPGLRRPFRDFAPR